MSKLPARRSYRLAPDHFQAAMAATLEAFPPGNPAGVFGVAIQRKRVRGHRTAVWTVAVFLPRKQLQPVSPIQSVRFRHKDSWLELMPDVVATGRDAAGAAGGSPHFTGLHAGAALRIDAGHRCSGGVACLLGNGQEPTHLVTAGHLFPAHAGQVPVLAALSPSDPVETVGALRHNLLDGAAGIDAALVELTPKGVQMAKSSGTAPRLPRLLPEPFAAALAESTWLRVFLAVTGDYQADLKGEYRFNQFVLQSACRSSHLVRNVLTTGFAHNTEGNSGTLLMNDDRSGGVSGLAVGIAVGFAGDRSLHEPMDRALERMASDTQQSYGIWSQP